MTTITTNSSGITLTTTSYSNPVSIASGVTIRNTSASGTAVGDVSGNTSAFTIVNSGSVIGGLAMELHASHSVVTNNASGYIDATGTGFGVRFDTGATNDTVVNSGTILSANHSGVAFISSTSGNVTNNSGGLIAGFTNGVYTEGGVTVINAGSIAGTGASPSTDGFGVNFKFGSNVLSNSATGVITGANIGVYEGTTSSNVIVNSGSISGPTGIQLSDGGSLTNQAGGRITGTNFAITAQRAAATITNAGTIIGTGTAGVAISLAAGGTIVDSGTIIGTGGTAIDFGTLATNNLLVLDPGYSITGAIADVATASNTVELAAGTGTLTGLGTTFQNFDVEVAPGAAWSLVGDNTLATGIDITGDGTLTNLGSIDASTPFGVETISVSNFVNDGTIAIGNGDLLDISTAVATDAGQAGTIDIGTDSILEIGGSVSAGQNIAFLDNTGELAVDNDPTDAMGNPSDFAGTISGLVSGDVIALDNLVYSTDSTATVSGDTLTVATDSGTAQFTVAGLAAGTMFTTQMDPNGGTDVMTVCYCRGTRIRTERGEVPVEALAIGDRVVTYAGTLEPIRWIGRRSYAGRFLTGKRHILPVRIRAGALADNVPSRDLFVSPNHAMYLDGTLIPALCLVNGVSVVQEETVEAVEYFHVELAEHGVIWAEGAASESFVDDDSRAIFHNWPEYHARYPEAARGPAVYCAPRLEDGYAVEVIRARIAERAGLARPAPEHGALRGFLDRASGNEVRGWAQDCAHPEVPVCLDILVDGRVVAQTLANRHRPDLQATGLGSGWHSFAAQLPAPLPGAGVMEVRRTADGVLLAYAELATSARPAAA